MDSLSFQFQASKLDKAYAKLRCKKKLIYKLVHFFRVIEICLISVFIWRNAAAAPQFLCINAKVNKDYFYQLLAFLSSPRTVFLIGNAIIFILFVESRQRQNMSSDEDDVSKPNTAVYDEYIRIKGGSSCSGGDGKAKNSLKVKSYKRSKSTNWPKMECMKMEKAELRRSATETKESCKQLIVVEEEAACAKGMSDDEFREMVEAFIARQQRTLRQES